MSRWFTSRTRKLMCSRQSGTLIVTRKEARDAQSNIKSSSNVLIDSLWVINQAYAPQCQNITIEKHLEVIYHLPDAVRHQRSDMWTAETWQLHSDNAPANRPHLIQTFLSRNNIHLFCQTRYLPTWLLLVCDCTPN